MIPLYPLRFTPIYHERVWGGNKLKNILQKKDALDLHCGEAWEVSCVENNISLVETGVLTGRSLLELLTIYKSDLLGVKVYEQYGESFPLLIKFIDAQENLSIQVHPYDLLAKARHNSLGKTEMWYILDADEEAFLIYGFKGSLTKELYLKAVKEKALLDEMNKVYVKKGDIFYIPAGMVHAIGGGVMLAEIQQSSDVTYRLYDWDRVGLDGNPRELHTSLALEALEFTQAETEGRGLVYDAQPGVREVINSPYFKTSFLHVVDEIILPCGEWDSFSILICLEGIANLLPWDVTLKPGTSVLLPACLENVIVKSSFGKLLEVHL